MFSYENTFYQLEISFFKRTEKLFLPGKYDIKIEFCQDQTLTEPFSHFNLM